MKPYISTHDDAVFVTLLDTETGDVMSSRDWAGERGSPSAWWARGNGSDDCNRELVFGVEDQEEVHDCLGARRYVVIAVETPDGALHPQSAELVEEMNEDYPLSAREAARAWKP